MSEESSAKIIQRMKQRDDLAAHLQDLYNRSVAGDEDAKMRLEAIKVLADESVDVAYEDVKEILDK